MTARPTSAETTRPAPNDTMTVWFVNRYSGMGGGEQALLVHARDLRRRGLDVRVALRERGELVDRLAAEGIECTLWPDVAGQRELTRRLRLAMGQVRTACRAWADRASAVWVYTLEDLVWGGPLLRLVGRRVLYRAQGEIPVQLASGAASHRAVARGLASCEAVACTTDHERAMLREAFAGACEPTTVPLGIDAERFRPSDETGPCPAGGASTGRAGEVVRVGMFGRLVPWKGHETFLRALAGLDAGASWRAAIVGDATYGQEGYARRLAGLAERLGIADRVEWVGFRRDVEEWMRRCDVVVHASLREPFGLVVAEAMASGSAVIASNTIGPAEIIEPGRNGLLTEPGDVEGLRDALTGLLVDAALRDRLARAGRQRILERFDLRRSLEGLFSLTLGRASIDEGDGQSTSSLGARRADADT